MIIGWSTIARFATTWLGYESHPPLGTKKPLKYREIVVQITAIALFFPKIRVNKRKVRARWSVWMWVRNYKCSICFWMGFGTRYQWCPKRIWLGQSKWLVVNCSELWMGAPAFVFKEFFQEHQKNLGKF